MKRKNLIRHTNPTLYKQMTRKGAPRPAGSSEFWNDWAANNPQPAALALGEFDFAKSFGGAMKAIATGARPVDK